MSSDYIQINEINCEVPLVEESPEISPNIMLPPQHEQPIEIPLQNNPVFTSVNEELHWILEEQYVKYENEEYMSEKMTNYIRNQLPVVLQNMKQQHELRVNRIAELTNEQDIFIQSFLQMNQCFYVQQTEKFFYYDGFHYQMISEDDIIHNILSSISKDRQIMSWKHKTKINLMKRIKENNLLYSIPESNTIQFVLESLCPAIFQTKKEAKYFLTILGDNIFRKNSNLIHYVDPAAKRFLRELNSSCQLIIGSSLSQTFKFKFYEHAYNDCRLIKINKTVKNETTWSSIYSTIDILCVACHYSNRYLSSDNFMLKICNDDALVKSVFYLCDIEPVDIVHLFLNEFIQIDNSQESVISWKNMQYMWKQFLELKILPSVMFLNTFKTILIEFMPTYYNAELDIFQGVYCNYFESIQKFMQFWETSIVYDDNEFDFEVEELSQVYKKWCGEENSRFSYLNDGQMIDIISYFFPNIEIEKNKFISGIRCILWDKQMEIQMALDKLKETYANNHGVSYNTISIHDAYIFYRIYYANVSTDKQLVSKSYFERYIFDNLTAYLVDFKFIAPEWYLSS
jgi:hypothetical protein